DRGSERFESEHRHEKKRERGDDDRNPDDRTDRMRQEMHRPSEIERDRGNDRGHVKDWRTQPAVIRDIRPVDLRASGHAFNMALQPRLKSNDAVALLSIGEVSRRLGTNPSALRYYEQRGLLRPASKRGGRRMYGPGDLRRIALLRLAHRLGIG